ncbi:hypothetical protein B0H67DRAFT_578174 [Lasiosphaeris hirsuta]|uniref:Uncharacterized protein n=1 Tax=Lasiosphaeris hirsuta TaxID=260670 RepID=A0AA40ASD1_9PEZI|nr:hypothetical protein B0H67DRAFT_578174 [Lasiosphaeris hirsuta]
METSHISPPAGDQTYDVSCIMVPPHSPHDTDVSYNNAPWGVWVWLEGVDLAMMQKGLSWTTQNIMLLSGQRESWKAMVSDFKHELPWKQDVIRVWGFREFPGRHPDESRWHGSVILFAHSTQTLDGFRLGNLKRQLICHAWVVDHTGNKIFAFDADEPGNNRNDLFRSHSDACDLWWLWPMDSIVPEDEGEGLSRPQVGGGKQERESESRVTGGQASFSGSIRVVAWGILILLSAVSIVVLGFGVVVIAILAMRA